MKERFAICLACVLCILAACGSKKTAKQPQLTREFPSAEIPSMITEPDERMVWLTQHFWDRFTAPDSLYFCDSVTVNGVKADDLEKQVGIFATLLQQNAPAEGIRAMENMYDRMEAFQLKYPEGNLFQWLTDKVSDYLYDPNSPVRNEEMYLPLATKLSKSPLVEPVLQGRYAWEAQKCSLNRIGTKAADFKFIDTEGRKRSLYGINGQLTILIFGNPDCNACKEIQEVITGIPELSAAIDRGEIKVVDIYIDEDIDSWKAGKDSYPSAWINGYDPGHVIREDLIYNVRAIPSIYLLDADKTVVLKDASPEMLFSALGL